MRKVGSQELEVIYWSQRSHKPIHYRIRQGSEQVLVILFHSVAYGLIHT